MYQDILDKILKDMSNFGLISTIVVSDKIFNDMTKKQKNHIEGFVNGNFKWLILKDTEKTFYFKYLFEPTEFTSEI